MLVGRAHREPRLGPGEVVGGRDLDVGRLAGDRGNGAARPPRPATRSRSRRARSAGGARTPAAAPSARNACGVCTERSSPRTSVSTTRPSRTRLTVSVTGSAGTAPSWLGERGEQPVDQLRRRERPGRVVHQDRLRVVGHLGQAGGDRERPRLAAGDGRGHLPGRQLVGRSVAGSSHSAGTTSTIRSTAGWSSSRSIECARSGRPPSRTNAFGRSAPSRAPSPPATTIAQVALISRPRPRSPW